jgi:hypothetical protein
MKVEVKEVMREGGRDQASAKERGEVEGTGTKRQARRQRDAQERTAYNGPSAHAGVVARETLVPRREVDVHAQAGVGERMSTTRVDRAHRRTW